MRLLAALACVVAVAAAAENQRVQYNGHQVIRVQVENEEQAEFLAKLQTVENLDFWTNIRMKGPVDIRVAPTKSAALQSILTNMGFQHHVMIEDVQKLMDEEKAVTSKRSPKLDWVSYHRIEEINDYLDEGEDQR